MTCYDCKMPLNRFIQPSLMANRPGYELVECENPACDLFRVTLPPEQLEGLTDERRAEYRKVNREMWKPK